MTDLERRSNGRINDQRRCLEIQIKPSAPDDPTQGMKTVGLIRRIDDVSSAGSEQEFPSGPDDSTPIRLMRRTIRPVLRQQFEDLTATLSL